MHTCIHAYIDVQTAWACIPYGTLLVVIIVVAINCFSLILLLRACRGGFILDRSGLSEVRALSGDVRSHYSMEVMPTCTMPKCQVHVYAAFLMFG